LITYTKEIDAIFDKELNNLALNDYECVGISYQFYQWIPGNILTINLDFVICCHSADYKSK
ncbi:MAG: hypothetical protein PHO84_09680, partial [Dysgonamonadaceae bacterium]|nr:hypothetical protein [Dysgonamonadaceae bacterium]